MPNTISSDMKIFLEQLLEDAGYIHVTRGVKEQMLTDLYVRLDNKLIATAFEHLPNDEVDPFSEMVERRATGDEMNAFLVEKIPHLKEVFASALIDFRNSYLGVAAAPV